MACTSFEIARHEAAGGLCNELGCKAHCLLRRPISPCLFSIGDPWRQSLQYPTYGKALAPRRSRDVGHIPNRLTKSTLCIETTFTCDNEVSETSSGGEFHSLSDQRGSALDAHLGTRHHSSREQSHWEATTRAGTNYLLHVDT